MILLEMLDTTRGYKYGLWKCENCSGMLRMKIKTGTVRKVCYQCEQAKKRKTTETEAFKIKNEDIKERECLMCGKMFTSTWKGHRRCDKCTRNTEETERKHIFTSYKSVVSGDPMRFLF